MGAPKWPPTPRTFVAPRRSRDARLIDMGAPKWPPTPPTFVAPRRSRDAPLFREEIPLREHERNAGGVGDGAELGDEVVGDGHAVAEALGLGGDLGVAGDEDGLGGIRALGSVQDVDHLVEVVFERAGRAE